MNRYKITLENIIINKIDDDSTLLELENYISVNQKEMINEMTIAISNGVDGCIDYLDHNQKFNNMINMDYYQGTTQNILDINKYPEFFTTFTQLENIIK